MARKKYKFDKENKKVYKVEIDNNIIESSSTPETEEMQKKRDERKAQRALRRAIRTKRKLATPLSTNEEKRYDVLAQYHQLNYDAIQNAIKELDVKPKLINNQYLIIVDIDKEELEKIKEALIKCHFETKAHKQYKVRVAAYKHNTIIKTEVKDSKPTNNKSNTAAKAKATRKENAKKAFSTRSVHSKRTSNNHKPGSKNTSNLARKIKERANKACKFIEKKEKEKAKQLNYHHKKKSSNKAKQQTIKFAA